MVFIEPEWASYSIGVFLCATCCGIHRSLGTHISKTKGIKLDNWDDEQVAVGFIRSHVYCKFALQNKFNYHFCFKFFSNFLLF